MAETEGLLVELGTLAEELCEPHMFTAAVYDDNGHGRKRLRRAWTTVQPGLLAQLRATAHEGLRVDLGQAGALVRSKPTSRPPGCFDALNAHVYIAAQAIAWIQPYEPVRPMPEGNVRALVGLAPTMDWGTFREVVREVRYWRGMAASVTGWVTRPYSPPVPCPTCRTFASVRINLDTRAAHCANHRRSLDGTLQCGAAWPPGSAEPLFAYVRGMLAGQEAA